MIEVGSAENHQDFNAGLVGMSPGETKDIRATYDEDNPSKKLAGKTVSYTVTLKSIKEKSLPAADDEFAKDLGDFENMAALFRPHRAAHGSGPLP